MRVSRDAMKCNPNVQEGIRKVTIEHTKGKRKSTVAKEEAERAAKMQRRDVLWEED